MSEVALTNLSEVALLNPRDKFEISQDTKVSFVPMSAISADIGAISEEEIREFSEVSKGFTPFLDSDVLVAKITPCFQNGKIAQANINKPYGFGSTEFHVVRPKPTKLDVRYLFHFLRQPAIRVAGERRMTGSAGQRRVPVQFLAKLKIPLPPLAEQKRIAEVLDRAEALRAQRRAALALLDELTHSIFLDMFGDPAFSSKSEYPQLPLASFIRNGDRINYGVVQPGEFDGDGVPLVRVGDLLDGKVLHDSLKFISRSIEEKYRRSRLVGNEVLLVCVGASAGLVAIADESVKGFNIARAIARIPLADTANPLFIAEYLRTHSVQRRFQSELRTVAQPTLNIKQINELMITCFPIKQQNEFANRIASLANLKSINHQALEQLGELFSSLQQRAFKGELLEPARESVTVE